jgi:hypothetical protein
MIVYSDGIPLGWEEAHLAAAWDNKFAFGTFTRQVRLDRADDESDR